VSPEDARRQKPTQLGLPLQARGEAPREQRSGEASTLTNGEVRSGGDHLYPPPAAGSATQTVETRPQGLCRVAQTRRSRGRCWASRRKHPPVVAQLGSAPAARSRYSLLRPHGSAKTCPLTSTFRTAGCGPACPVVWQGSSGAPLPPMPIGLPL
jgi:hypothetical protein